MFVRCRVAFGMAPPLESVMVPLSVARVSCASAGLINMANKRVKAVTTEIKRFITIGPPEFSYEQTDLFMLTEQIDAPTFKPLS
jgi:hypothetical protein